jgi:hypothetical protein
MTGTLTSLLFVEIAVTVIAAAMFIWRGFLDMKEDDHLILDQAEAHLDREQAVIRKKVNVLTKYIHVVGVVWSVLGVVLVGMWVVQGLSLI